jgi:hypothetical protein
MTTGGETVHRVHWSFWVIGVLALIWNAMGGVNFFMQMNPETLASMPQSHRAIAESRPLWASGAFAVGVFGGVMGCILLLLRKRTATSVFNLSLIGVLATMIHAYVWSGAPVGFGPFEIALAVLMPLAVAAFLVWYSMWAKGKAWLT